MRSKSSFHHLNLPRLKAVFSDDEVGKKEAGDKSPIVLDLKVKKLPMDKWKPIEGFEREEVNPNVLVVYYDGTSTSANLQSEPNMHEMPFVSSEAGNDNFTSSPQRVQINSEILLKELARISGTKTTKIPTVMVPPFKVLVAELDKLTESLATIGG